MQINSPGMTRLFNEGKVVKVTTEIVNNSNVLQNDDELFFPMVANSDYQIDVFVRQTSVTAVPDMQVAFVGPAGVQFGGHITRQVLAGGTGVQLYLTSGSSIDVRIDAGASYLSCQARLFVTTTNAGNFQLQWAQNVAAIEDTKVLAGSFIYWRKVL